MSRLIKPCSACGSSCDHQHSEYCSVKCKTGAQAVATLGDQLIDLKPAAVKHIYFYDFAFGDLCDLFTTYLIKHLHAADLQKQRVVLRALERVERSITTKLDKYSPPAGVRKAIKTLLAELYKENMRIWRWKDTYFARHPGEDMEILTPTDEAWQEFVSANEARNAARRQLDRLVEGTTMTDRTYDQSHA